MTSKTETRNDKLRDAHDKLQDAVAEIVSGDEWKRMLQVASKFHKGHAGSSLLERGFEQLKADHWSFPYLGGHVLTILEEFDELALIDEAGELFQYPLSAAPVEWYEHVTRERNCLVITGPELRLARDGMAGVHEACTRGTAFGGSVLAHDGMTDADRSI